jgi:pimeloyl-ACP methyl ester carboxylesterase
MTTSVEARGLTFDVHTGGPEGGDPVLLLHGFPQDGREWDRVTPHLHAVGLRTYALDQRGYSPGARPATVADYRMAECVADAVAVLDALGVGAAHVVGHDWGATVGWHLAARHAERVRTLTAVSVPHPLAMTEAIRAHWSQGLRLAYVGLFRRRGLAERVLSARDGAVLRRMMGPAGHERAERYTRAMLEPGRLTGGLNWYRALSGRDLEGPGPVTVPTTYVWSDRDGAVGPEAARRCATHVTGDYRFLTLTRVSHWIPDQAPDALAGAVLARIAAASR